MANSFTGLVYTNIAQRILTELVKMLAPLRAFTTDFSADVAMQSEAVTTNIVVDPGVASSLSGTHSNSRITAASADTSVTPVTISMDQDPVSGFHVTDREAARIADGIFTQLVARKVSLHARAVALHVLNYVYNLMTYANYGEGTNVGAPAGFTYDDLADLEGTLVAAGFPPAEAGEVALLLKPTYVAALKKDNMAAFKDLEIYPVINTPTMPPSGGTPASENLIGAAALPESLGIATRVVEPQSMQGIEHFEIVQDPETGLAIAYRATVHDGVIYHTCDLLYGAKKLDGSKLHPLRSDASGN